MEQDRGPTAASPLQASGKDEMNLAEFPITLLSERVPRGQKTIEFEDRFYDDGTGKVITRKVTITGSDKYGLPTSKDDEVILGLIQLTKMANGFGSRTVNFCRSDLIQLLGWPDTGQSYRRLARSFDCWTFTGLSYENAWWDHQHRSWVSEKFHILDRVTLYDKDRGPRPGDQKLASFTWSEVIFHSFQSGYLKRFDFDFYLGLKTSTSKRMYRFLDKRFYLKRRWEFDLKDFALTHVGLSHSYEGGTQLARKLRPAIEELEAKGFLEPLGEDARFLKGSPGEWKIVLIGASSRRPVQEKVGKPAPSELETALIGRGVTPTTAAQLAEEHPADRIRAKVEAFDWLKGRKDRRLGRNPAGYLVQSIRDDYAAPPGFEPQADRARRLEAEQGQRRAQAEARRQDRQEERDREQAQQARIAAYWDALSPAQRAALEAQALASSHPLLGLYRRHQGQGTPAERRYRKLILDAHILERLGDG